MRAFHKKSGLARCTACGLHVPMCICTELVPQKVRSRVTLLMHIKESRRTSNTGRLIPLLLDNAEVRIRGRKDQPLCTRGLFDDDRESVLLFPSEDAEILDAKWISKRVKPIHLIVPDGNWRQARRMRYREPSLATITPVKLGEGSPSQYRLRSHPDPACLSTFEAVSRALGLLEGPELQNHLERVFHRFVGLSLWARGDLTADEVTGGIPSILTNCRD